MKPELESNPRDMIEAIKQLKKPKLMLILSGKRKSGKDFLERLLIEKYPNKILSFRISAPIKHEYAQRNGLNYEEMLTASQYKESFRKQMVEWSENIRLHDPHYFLRLAILNAYRQTDGANCPIWILNDARRPTDLRYFEPDENEIDLTGCKKFTIRIQSEESVRHKRGWIFTKGIDDQTTECGLDSYESWDYLITNNGTKEELICQLHPIIDFMKSIEKEE